MTRKKNIVYPLAQISLLLLVCLGVMVSCEKDSISPALESSQSGVPTALDIILGSNFGQSVESRVYVASSGIIGATSPTSYRVQGNIKKQENPSEFYPAKSLDIGNVSVSSLTSEQVVGEEDPLGVFNQMISLGTSEQDFSNLQALANQPTSVKFYDENGVYDETQVNLAPYLITDASQNGIRLADLSEVDKTQPITVSWSIPDNSSSGRSSGGTIVDKVGAMVMYSPQQTRLNNPSTEVFPDEIITAEFVVPIDIGSITFTADDLALFPDNGMITVYVGHVRYEVDDNGELISSPAGTSVVSGGTQGTLFVRVNEP